MFQWILGGLTAFFTISYLSRLKRASENITSIIRVGIHKVTLTGIELKAQVKIQNPNPISIKIQQPFVKILYNEKILGTSSVEDTVIEIPENGEKTFELIIRSAGWLTLIQLLGIKIATDIRNGTPIQLNIQTQIISRVNGLPYEKNNTHQIQL